METSKKLQTSYQSCPVFSNKFQQKHLENVYLEVILHHMIFIFIQDTTGFQVFQISHPLT